MHDSRKVLENQEIWGWENKGKRILSFPSIFFISSLFVLIVFISPASGQGDVGKIEGQIVDQQKNLPLAQQLVILQIHQGEDVQQRQTVTDKNGFYVFDRLSMTLDVHYTLSTTYEGKEYVERNLVLSAWVPELKANIEIGAFTDDPSKVKIQQHTLVISPPPSEHPGAVQVMEIIHVDNTSDLAFQTSIDNQQMGLYFNLPNGYEHLQLDQIFKQDLVTNANRLTSNQPLASGKSSVGYSYLIHIDQDLNLARKLTFDTDQLYVFIAEGMSLTPQSRILGAGRQERIHNEMVYTIYATNPAKPLSAGQTAELRFKVASVGPVSQQGNVGGMTEHPSDPKMIGLIAIAAALAGGFLVAAIFKVRTPTTLLAESQTPQTNPDASWLRKLDAVDIERTRVARLEMITCLEELHEKREISERVYKRLQKEQADRLAAVLERSKQ